MATSRRASKRLHSNLGQDAATSKPARVERMQLNPAPLPGQPAGQQPLQLPVVVHTYPLLVDVRLNKRYKRFLADVQVTAADDTKTVVTVHCPNTGPMTGLLDWPLAPACLSVSENAKRKYAHTLEMVQDARGTWVGVHPAHANNIVKSMLRSMLIPELLPYDSIQAEVKYGKDGKSRVDFLLKRPTTLSSVYAEVKSVTLAADKPEGPGRIALFPDTVSDRAQRHMRELISMVESGHEAAVVFLIQRDDCDVFAPAHAIDPKYGQLLLQAAAAGVKVVALRCRMDPNAGTGQVQYLGPAKVELEYGLSKA
ncbi:hypothetical protein WJX72_004075 [[Myrmecia] bisecta]|uniref:Sugar fermentation stimulation protein homolog n=1 Tax=[Myrmecia] bisecta TaxID=41462 RepID=A0AAW1PPA6_9CHLO